MKFKRPLSSESIKIIASATMLIDHSGALLFPQVAILRAIGRISMPLFAFLIAEGCRHTKSKEKYFSRLFILGSVCQLIYIIFSRAADNYINILLTYAATVGSIMLFERAAERLCLSGQDKSSSVLIAALVVIIIISGVFSVFDFSYGLWAAAMIYAAYFLKDENVRFAVFSLFLLLYCLYSTFIGYPIQLFAMFSLPLILMYNGKRGNTIPSWFWYLFYPGHLGVLWLLQKLIF